MSWTDGLDRNKYTKTQITKWKSDEKHAKKSFAELQKNPHKHLPITAPARMAYDDSTARSRVLKEKMKSAKGRSMSDAMTAGLKGKKHFS